MTRLAQMGWTQEQLAVASGISRKRIMRIINCQVSCSMDTMGRILHALEVRAMLSVKAEDKEPKCS